MPAIVCADVRSTKFCVALPVPPEAIARGVVRESDVNEGAAVTDTIGCAGLGVVMTMFDPAASDVTCGGMTATAELHTPVTVALPDV